MTELIDQEFCLASGNRALLHGDYDQARSLYRRALEQMPELGSVIKANLQLTEIRRLRATHADALKCLLNNSGWTFEQVLHWAMVWLRAILAGAAIKSAEEVDKTSRQSYKGLYNPWVSNRFIGVTPDQFVNRPEGLPQYLSPLFREEQGYDKHDLPLAGLLYGGMLATFTKITSVAEPKDSQWFDPRHLVLALGAALEQVVEASDHAIIHKLWRLPDKPPLWARAD